MNHQQPKLLDLFLTFFMIGAFTFGGGIAMLPIVKRKLVAKGWIEEHQFGDSVAVAQTAPGAIAVNLATTMGYQLRGILGAIVAALGMVLPSLIVITIVAMGLEQFATIPEVHHALQGITLVVILLMTDAIIDLGKSNLKDLVRWTVAILAFVFVYFFNVPTPLIIGVGIILGVLKTVMDAHHRQESAHD
jgi:chromate transporter